MDRKEEIRKELEEISPFLSKLEKENPFEVPYGYFDKMQREVLEQTKGENPAAASVSIWKQISAFMLQPRMAMGGLAIVLVAWSGLFLWRQQEVVEPLADQEWVLEANAYIAANIDEFDDELLSELVFEAYASTEESTDVEAEEEQLMNEILDELEDVDIEDLL